MTTRALSLPSSDATCALAASLAPRLRPGDVLLLDGGIGAGKTHFARCLIQSLQEDPEDVPSPTFTLVQVYDVPTGELWHTDLYRLSDPDQVVELGLAEAFEDAICLVEWPDRLEDLTPKAALSLSFEVTGDDSRRVTLSWQDPRWDALLEALDA
ncbi:tRNA (adenosine(37)-N6)-threonylcarbamoyltransferase complex ATPase subunit type 1 TsaE [Salipiger sp. PrR002]|uniref:tRNA (adenosine(37)-N6)-threonylcarbamoyltransferase complex ATPase subunit type 1 TsaE n=1 Tax=Salipiger sp. PrR002 TaxID=2706489 RepID=UPI0013BE75D9|nr:tRNA (adenosine(37)-N6)-threonylcarbamoyltransferase complex ATPase subunit type 1 TsaE [Salipiger sp. PrR002]NDV98242.1 tRNA (adenosine(37)-N6)-threonylcarbamoyltransferase complex ATPase subunit type 1 TsaE [Salipiger sp. PrR002]NDW54954.1 tRNA (adenosine(37)-N6)-threonylcarbamoyltransferase complex ATPase subunit type 1 TsaE [Salipiger sp. PrR004]